MSARAVILPALLSVSVVVSAVALAREPASWPQFRGPNASGVSPDDRALPAEIGPDANILWKVPVPPGHSSPAIVGDRIYLTGDGDGKLLTLALDRATGSEVWTREAPLRELEPIHTIGSRAQPSPAADEQGVVSFFGSSGLLAYDREGERRWHVPMGPFNNEFGAGSSPVIVDDRVLLAQDHDEDSFLAAFDRKTGDEVWRADRSEFPRGYSTPVVREVGGARDVIVAGTLRVAGYDLASGEELWTVRGLARLVNTTPVVAPDGHVIVACWTSGGGKTDRFDVPAFDAFLAANDGDGDGLIAKDEVPEGPLEPRFHQIDRDKSGRITREEYEGMRRIFDVAQNVALSIRPGGRGDLTSTHVVWRYEEHLPYVPSPLLYGGIVYLVKNGGILVTLDAGTGESRKLGRVSGRANYYASPVAGDGKVYLVDQRGRLSVVRATAEWEEIATADFGEPVYATPALLDGRIYLRAGSHLYCFGSSGLR